MIETVSVVEAPIALKVASVQSKAALDVEGCKCLRMRLLSLGVGMFYMPNYLGVKTKWN